MNTQDKKLLLTVINEERERIETLIQGIIDKSDNISNAVLKAMKWTANAVLNDLEKRIKEL